MAKELVTSLPRSGAASSAPLCILFATRSVLRPPKTPHMKRTDPMPVKFRLFFWIAMLLLPVLSASARDKISVAYAKGFSFSQYKTYAWAEHGAVAHPLLAADLVGAIDQELQARGLQKVTSNPDLIIQFYGSVDNDMTMYSNDPLYGGTGGIPPFDPSMTGPTFIGFYGNTSVVIHKGDLVVDLIDAKAKKLVWRGM